MKGGVILLKSRKSKVFVVILLLFVLFGCSNLDDRLIQEDYIPPVLNKECYSDIKDPVFDNGGDAYDYYSNNSEISSIQHDSQDDAIENEEKNDEKELSELKEEQNLDITQSLSGSGFELSKVPQYNGQPYVEINNNVPLFHDSEKNTNSFELYSELDSLGRCGVAYANISIETMPTEERGTIGDVRPSGWHTVKYNDLIDGNYLYNRCHLIGYQLAGENANIKNLITGTRYLNIQGMLPFENMVCGYVQETGNHVLYRVTPIFEGNNLVASGVTMEGFSVEDNGKGICFYVYAYNIQPGIIIDYLSGDSERDPNYVANDNKDSQQQADAKENEKESVDYPDGTYILNTNTHKFHYPNCKSVEEMAEKNKKVSTETREKLIEQGYSPCKRCNP